MSGFDAFVTTLADQYPPLAALRDKHLQQNFGELLPYVLFGAFVHWLEASVLDESELDFVRSILADLDWVFESASEDVRNLISVQLLENLPLAGEPAGYIREMLGPNLRIELQRYHSSQGPDS